MSKVYIMGSMRNPGIVEVANLLEAEGHDVYANWQSSGPEADACWKEHAKARGRTFLEELHGPHVAMVFDNDKKWLDWADVGLLVLPAGKSAFAELGYLRGSGTPTIALLEDADPERWDIMLRFADYITASRSHVIELLRPGFDGR